ncbi:hypothetical protein BaRGS_00020427 [Batillaria attramentaria]|uniref:Uncharacterized protein n=1 Tax=Batillaria attramentaria TaxID=370345 RepID=A0ABD0KML4_9CAEN
MVPTPKGKSVNKSGHHMDCAFQDFTLIGLRRLCTKDPYCTSKTQVQTDRERESDREEGRGGEVRALRRGTAKTDYPAEYV